MPTPQSGQIHSNNLSAFTNELLESVWPFCGVGTYRVKDIEPGHRINCVKNELFH